MNGLFDYFYSILYYIINITMSKDKFEAADVFILHKHPTDGYCVVLFEDARDDRAGCVTMPGGQWGGHFNLPAVAAAELFEESSKSIKVTSTIFEVMDTRDMYVDIRGINYNKPTAEKKRRVYFCSMPVIQKEIYDANNKLLKNANWKYRETKKLIFISINSIINSITEILKDSKYMKETKMKDINKKSYFVQRITIDALYKFLIKKQLLYQSFSAGGGQNFPSLTFLKKWWYTRAPQTSKVSMTGNVPPVSYLAPISSVPPISSVAPISSVPPLSSRRRQYSRTHRAHHSPRTHRAQNSPKTHRAQNSPRTHRAHHYYRPKKKPFNDTDTIVHAMLQHYIYVFTEHTITRNEDNTITMNY